MTRLDGVAVSAYFAREAPGYHVRSLRHPWAFTRRRELAAVARLLGDLRGRRVIDLGCGAGYYARFALEWGASHVDAVDFTPAMLESLPARHAGSHAGAGGTLARIVADVATVSLPTRADRIIAAGVLEFVPNPDAVLSNARRLATDDGVMVVLAPSTTKIASLYALFHARHGLAIDRSLAERLDVMAPRAGWRLDAVEPVWPFAMAARLRAS